MHPLEVKARLLLKSGKRKPTPAGVLVLGVMPGSRTPVRSWCKGHLFQTKEAVKDSAWQSGWKQGARCIVCKDEVLPIDASWWVLKAKKSDIKKCMRLLKERAAQDRRTYANLKKRLPNYEEED